MVSSPCQRLYITIVIIIIIIITIIINIIVANKYDNLSLLLLPWSHYRDLGILRYFPFLSTSQNVCILGYIFTAVDTVHVTTLSVLENHDFKKLTSVLYAYIGAVGCGWICIGHRNHRGAKGGSS